MYNNYIHLYNGIYTNLIIAGKGNYYSFDFI